MRVPYYKLCTAYNVRTTPPNVHAPCYKKMVLLLNERLEDKLILLQAKLTNSEAIQWTSTVCDNNACVCVSVNHCLLNKGSTLPPKKKNQQQKTSKTKQKQKTLKKTKHCMFLIFSVPHYVSLFVFGQDFVVRQHVLNRGLTWTEQIGCGLNY